MADALVVPGGRRTSVPLILPLRSRRANTGSKLRFSRYDNIDDNAKHSTHSHSTHTAIPARSEISASKRWAHSFCQIQKHRPSSRKLLRYRVNEGPQTNSFNSFPITSTPHVLQMAQYYVQIWAPEHGCAFGMEGHPNPYLSILWPYAMHHEVYFEALITLCLATWLLSREIQASRDRLFLLHRANVVTKLRERLAAPNQCADDCTTLTVATLGTIDYVLGAHETALAHVDGMRQIIRMRGQIEGSSLFHRLLQVNVKAFEDLWSFVTESTSPIEGQSRPTTMVQQGALPTYMVHPFKPEVCVMMSRLPRGFCDIGLKGLFSLQMIKVLTALNESSTDNAIPYSPTHPLTPESAQSPFSVSSSQTPTHIREILQDLHRLATMRTTTTEHMLCYGLIAYCYTIRRVYFNDKFGAFYTFVVDVICQKSLRHKPDNEELDRNCYLWCSVVIATTLMDISCSATGKYMVFEHLMKNHSQIRDWQGVKNLMSNFFWPDELAEKVYRSWQEAQLWYILPEQQRRSQFKKPAGMSIRDVII